MSKRAFCTTLTPSKLHARELVMQAEPGDQQNLLELGNPGS